MALGRGVDLRVAVGRRVVGTTARRVFGVGELVLGVTVVEVAVVKVLLADALGWVRDDEPAPQPLRMSARTTVAPAQV